MHIVVLAGGIGGARFLQGVRRHARATGARVTAIVNVGDDITVHGLRVCPDLDSVMYTLGGGADRDRGWGRADETWTVKSELAAYGAQPEWFGLGDRDVATHLVRSAMLAAGHPLSAVTRALCERWRPGVDLLPATDDRLETHVETEAGTIHFQEWWIRSRARIPARRFVFAGAEAAKPAPEVLAALQSADAVLLAPSNPVVSIGPILAVRAVRDAVASGRPPVVGVAPIIGGAPVRGMADACLAALGVECSAAAVGRLYGARGAGGGPGPTGGGWPQGPGMLDGWLVDADADAGAEVPGVTVRAVPLWMADEAATAAMVAAALAVAREVAR